MRILGAELGQLFVLQLDSLAGQVALDRVPGGIDAEDLHVGSPFVHARETLGRHGTFHHRGIAGLGLPAHQRGGLGHNHVRVDVDSPHAAPAHRYLPPLGRGSGLGVQGVIEEAAPCEQYSRGGGGLFHELSAIGHRILKNIPGPGRGRLASPCGPIARDAVVR